MLEAPEMETEIRGISFEADKAAELEYRLQGFTVRTGDAVELGSTAVELEDTADELEEVISAMESAVTTLRQFAGDLEEAAEAEADED